MMIGFLVMAGYGIIGIERCWKRLAMGRWYSWESNFVTFFEALFKANNWSFDLKILVCWFGIDLGPAPVLERQHRELLPKHVVWRYKALKRISSRSPYLPVFSRRFLSDH